MILAGTEIQAEVEAGNIVVDPFDPKHLNPASLDLTLGDEVAVYEDMTYLNGFKNWDEVVCGPFDGRGLQTLKDAQPFDVKKPPAVRKFKMDPELGWVVRPGMGYLMHTVERVATDKYVPEIDGKSSLGRIFLWVHVTAGLGDPGFDGQYTLEVTSLFPLRVYPGMRICQMRFYAIQGEPVNYREVGHYVGDKALGAVPSEVRRTGFNGK
jgi:dCTP deaminase